MDKVLNTQIRKLCRVTKGVDERIDDDFRLQPHGENEWMGKKVYVGKFAGSPSVGWPQKRWINTMKDCLKKKKFECQSSEENWV